MTELSLDYLYIYRNIPMQNIAGDGRRTAKKATVVLTIAKQTLTEQQAPMHPISATTRLKLPNAINT
jgi:hypothetical protein